MSRCELVYEERMRRAGARGCDFTSDCCRGTAFVSSARVSALSLSTRTSRSPCKVSRARQNPLPQNDNTIDHHHSPIPSIHDYTFKPRPFKLFAAVNGRQAQQGDEKTRRSYIIATCAAGRPVCPGAGIAHAASPAVAEAQGTLEHIENKKRSGNRPRRLALEEKAARAVAAPRVRFAAAAQCARAAQRTRRLLAAC